VTFGHVIFEICEQIDRQTYRHEDRNTSHPLLRRSNNDDDDNDDDNDASCDPC